MAFDIPDEELWAVFQTVYEPGSRGSYQRALEDQPDVVDGIRAVAEWARREAFKEAHEKVSKVIQGSTIIGILAVFQEVIGDEARDHESL